ncbi:MAG: ABC transporter permease [Bacilli bacterium]
MLTAVKNQLKVNLLSVKYSLMREMLNKTTFLMNIIFMILNNASFIIQWIILFSLRDNIGGYQLKHVLLLWALTSTSYGFSHFFFNSAYKLSDTINTGKLDAFLVQPKSVLLGAITSEVSSSAIGDIIYGYTMLFISGCSLENFFLFTWFSITGCLITTSIAVILGSLGFWFNKSDLIADTGNNLMIQFSTYPDGIFKGIVKIILYTIVPIGLSVYIPISILVKFNLPLFLLVSFVSMGFVIFAFFIFHKGLKKYSSSNLMVARV